MVRKTEIVIKDLKSLISSKGYIYALCMIIFEDFHINPEKIQEINFTKRLNHKEVSLLLGFLIQYQIDFTPPDSWQNLMQIKQKTYKLMEELHQSFIIPFVEKMQKNLEKKHEKKDLRKEQKEFFGKGNILTEPIFYSGTGVYDFQYLEFLERKYKYDKNWLSKKKNFDIEKTKNIVIQIKNILQEKSKKVRLYNIKERLPEIIGDVKKENPNEDWEKCKKELLPMFELYQYVELFFENVTDKKNLCMDKIGEDEWKSFYKGLIELFVIRKTDFDSDVNIESFLNNFSISIKKGINSQFNAVGNYNVINSHPIIKLDEEKYFVPIPFLLFVAIYESPFYWMIKNKEYEDQAGKNRGRVGEEITYDFLLKVFEKSKTFKSVKILLKKGKNLTDIDILCTLGSKALCVQVKSKKLTTLSRSGNDRQLEKDFQEAVQDAYEQGLVSRSKILEKNAKFIDENGNEIILSEEIDEVYLMVITTENYPSLTHQTHVMLDKKDNDPFPIVLTIFDLDLLTYYLNDPYDFLYYIRQRTSLMDYFKADEEMTFLGYHLKEKLWKIPNVDASLIATSFGQLVDRNYYPLKAGLEVSDDGDTIKNRWKNENFDRLCYQLKNIGQAKITDIIFHLLDWSGNARKNFVDLIIKIKQKTLNDGKIHNFSMPPDDSFSPRVGVTYTSSNSDNVGELRNNLLMLCQVRKYKYKGDVWIGFGSLKNSNNMIDVVVFTDQKWEYNEELEKMSKILLEGKGHGRYIRIEKKIGRNEKCPCGSGLKYKRCCGKNK